MQTPLQRYQVREAQELREFAEQERQALMEREGQLEGQLASVGDRQT